jgi:predicted SnoaL-like aldol condensation-catalyzing enzyme
MKFTAPLVLAALVATGAAHAQTNNRAVAERFVLEFLGQGSVEAAEAVIAPDVIAFTALSPAAPIEGRDAYVETFFAFAQAFTFETPIEIVDSFVTEDRAMMRIRARATHTGEFLGLPATNRSILFDETHVMRIEDGMVTENVVSATNLEFEMVFAPVLTPLVLGEE